MSLSLHEWHRRFLEQAQWTAALRSDLFAKAGIRNAARILEVGCGTGAVLSTLSMGPSTRRIGLDLDPARLAFARSQQSAADYIGGDAFALPFASQSCDIVYSHFLFLWLKEPCKAAEEMRRVVRRQGAVLSLAEPDYDARIDFPPALAELGRLQRDSLARQGADPAIGRRMAALMAESGLRVAEAGIVGARWTCPGGVEARSDEWNVLRADLQDVMTEDRLEELRQMDQAARGKCARVLFVPTFYCLAFRED
jgi:ubiquinone/menaquinone biosynthesis C-methylase UbiE